MLHFTPEEFARRTALFEEERERRGLDAVLLFAQESHYWLTGFDTFGFCFFQCLVAGKHAPTLLARSADLRQAQLTSTIEDVRIWKDAADANPAEDLADILKARGLAGKRVGIELDTHGLTAANYRKVEAALADLVTLVDACDLISTLRLTKSAEEIPYIRRAAELADDALDAALPRIKPGTDESAILAAMQGAVFSGGGDYPGNPFIIGAGDHALLCRYQSGRRTLQAQDQITLEWAGVYRQYHAAMMATPTIQPTDQHRHLHAACKAALEACEATLKPGNTMGDVFAAHAKTLDDLGLSESRLNACGYSLGTSFAPSWMEHQMFYEGAPTIIAPGMVFFLHMILMDSDTGTAMTLGRTSLVEETSSTPLSRHGLDLIAL
ncbi:MAG: Xaa-Pro peptidase family protein [Pseudomonadota bacterium]